MFCSPHTIQVDDTRGRRRLIYLHCKTSFCLGNTATVAGEGISLLCATATMITLAGNWRYGLYITLVTNIERLDLMASLLLCFSAVFDLIIAVARMDLDCETEVLTQETGRVPEDWLGEALGRLVLFVLISDCYDLVLSEETAGFYGIEA